MTKKYKSLQQLFRAESRWTQCAYARDKYGKEVAILSKKAVCFCLSGGIALIYPGSKGNDVTDRLINALNLRRSKYHSFTYYNDRIDVTINDIRSLVKEAGV